MKILFPSFVPPLPRTANGIRIDEDGKVFKNGDFHDFSQKKVDFVHDFESWLEEEDHVRG